MEAMISAASNGTRAHLKDLLLSRYAHLGRQLERFMGSKDDAADALQETWLRLEIMPDVGLRHGEAYLLRMASNIAVDQFRRERRHFHEEDIDDLYEVADELADPERIIAGRRRVEALKQALSSLPPRQQEIVYAARIGGELNREIAARLGISIRLVERELSLALKHCSQHLWETAAPSAGASRGRRKY